MNEVAVDRLLEHTHALRALARHLVGSEAAEDVVQDTFADALRAPPDDGRPAKPWLARVLRNRVKMRYRGESRRVHREQAIAADPITTTDPERIAARLETHRALCEVIAALHEPYRSTLVAHYYDGLSLAEIARQAGVPEGTVRSRHKQALERVRAGLDQRAGGDRTAWVAGLAPLVGSHLPVVLLGGIVVKKILVAIVLVVVAIIALIVAVTGPEPDRVPARADNARGVHIAFGAAAQPRLSVSGGMGVDVPADKVARAGARIDGRVLDEAAAPVARADVWLFDGRRVATRAAISDADGRFSIAVPNPGRFEVLASSGEQVSEARAVLLELGERQDIEVVIRNARVELTGRVVDEAERALAGATVELAGMLSKATRTDADGRFRFAGLVAGLYDVAALADGHVRAHVGKLVPAEGTVDITLRVARGVTVTGIARTAAGAPVAGASVSSTAWNLQDPRLEVETDERGRFHIGPLPTGSVRLSAFHPLHGVSEIQTIELPAGSAPSTDLVFRSSAGIDGFVRLDDGTPARAAAITLTADHTPARWSLEADDHGQFALSSLPEGEYTIEAAARADRPMQLGGGASASVKLRGGARERVELKIAAGSERVQGRVVDVSGAPVAGAAVWAETAGVAMSPMQREDIDTFSTADGTFELRDLTRGTYDIYASQAWRATGKLAGVRAGQTGITVQLAPGARVEGGIVGAGGKPIRSFRLQWKWLSRSGEHGQVMSSAARMIEDADGRFAIEGLEPTQMFVLTVETADGSTGDLGPFSLAAGERKTGLAIEVERMGRVRGRLVERETGAPAIGLVVWFPATSAREHAPLDGNGRFEAAVPAAKYPGFNVQSETQGYPTIDRAFTVEPSQTTDLGDVLIDLK